MDTMKLREALEDLERRMDSIGHNVELRNTGVAPHLVDKWALELAALAKSLAPPPVTNAAPPDSLERLCHQCGTLHVIPEGAECLKAAPEVQQNILQIAMRAGITVEWVRENYIPIKRIVIAAPLLPPTVNSALIGTDDREHFRVTAGCYCGWSIINDFEWEQHLKRITPAAAPALSEETPTELSREQIKEAYRILIRFTENGYDPIRFARWLATQPPAAREGGGEMVTASEALKKWADGPFACPTDPSHKLSYRGYHCEECGTFIGAPKSREELLTALITEREMHNAWRKRAEEAEVAEVALKAATPPHCPKCDTPLPDVEYRAEGQPARTWAAGESRKLVCSKCGYFYASAFLHADEPKVCPNDGTALATPSSAASAEPGKSKS